MSSVKTSVGRNPEMRGRTPACGRALGRPAEADPTMAREPWPGSSSSRSHTLLDAVLQNLYDFGETEDEAEQKRSRQKTENKKRDVGPPAALAAEPATPPGSLTRGQRKGALSFFMELSKELRCAAAVTPTSAPPGPQVPRAAASPNRKPVEVVEFHSRNKSRKQKPGEDDNPETKTSILEKDVDIQEFNLEKARLEVHRFGITGYGKGKERVLERERAIMLGAQPPKKSYVNYKVLQEQIKEKKAAKEEEKRMEIQKEEIGSQYFVKWTGWTDWKIQKWYIDSEPS